MRLESRNHFLADVTALCEVDQPHQASFERVDLLAQLPAGGGYAPRPGGAGQNWTPYPAVT